MARMREETRKCTRQTHIQERILLVVHGDVVDRVLVLGEILRWER